MTATDTKGKRRLAWFLFGLFLGLGVFFRLTGLGERNLWTDEAWVALAVRQADPRAVLALGQSTPPWYLLTVWLSSRGLGYSEITLRLTSTLFGLGTLLLFWPLARRLLPLGGAVAAFALVSISPRLVYYAKELKQYSADAFWVVALLAAGERLLAQWSPGGWLLFILLAALGLGFSHPLIFLLPPLALVLWSRLPEQRGKTALGFAFLGLVFLGYYLAFFRGQVDPELLIYWRPDFPDLSGFAAFWSWLGAAWLRYLGYFFGHHGWPVGLGLLGLGLLHAAVKGPRRLWWYFWGPLLVALAAATLERYPFMGRAGGVRLMLYSAPVLLTLTGAGIWVLLHWTWSRRPLFAMVCLAGLIWWLQPGVLWQENRHPRTNLEQIKPLVAYVQANRPATEPLYVYYFSVAPFQVYYQGPKTNIILGRSCHETCPSLLLNHEFSRVWLLASHFESLPELEAFARNLLGDQWALEWRRLEPGAALLRYQRRDPSPAPTPP